MSITRANLLTAVGYYYKYALTIKQDEAYKAMQWVCDDIASVFDMFRGLEDSTSSIALTEDQAYVDVSSYITSQRDNRISKVVLIDSANHDNDGEIKERDYLSHYLDLVPDPTNPSSAKDFDLPQVYARYKDNMYFYPIPDKSTLSVKIYFDKVHPTISASQDILYPSDFEEMIVTGVVGRLLEMADRKDGTVNDKLSKYYQMRDGKVAIYKRRPNFKRTVKCNW